MGMKSTGGGLPQEGCLCPLTGHGIQLLLFYFKAYLYNAKSIRFPTHQEKSTSVVEGVIIGSPSLYNSKSIRFPTHQEWCKGLL